MIVSLIVAVSENGVIGKDNNLIWHLPNDMKYFKEKTLGHHVIMGRKNFESIPHKFRPLKDRTNIIVTRQKKYIANGCIVVNSLKEGLAIAKSNRDQEPFIIGGGEIYKLALEKKLVDKIYLTRIHTNFEGDTFFPKLSTDWYIENDEKNLKDNYHMFDFTFLIYKK